MIKKWTIFATLLLTGLTCACGSGSQRTEPVLFSDNFSQTASGWEQIQGLDGTAGYLDKRYQILIHEVDTMLMVNSGQSFDGDISIEVSARKAGGPDVNYFGVFCRYQDADNYYMLLVSSDGYTGVVLRQGGQDSIISPGLTFLKMEGIKAGNVTNHLRADCIGNTMTLYVNGKQVNTATDPKRTFSGGGVGLVARTSRYLAGVDIRFDDFRVYDVSQP